MTTTAPDHGAATAVPQRASFDLFLSAPAVHEFYKVFIAPLRGAG